MNKHRFHFFLFSICLAGVLGFGTHALFIIHLSSCCDEHPAEHRAPSKHHHSNSNKPGHDPAQCSVCQAFSGVGGKYTAPAATASVFIETPSFQYDVFISACLSHYDTSCAIPRGPPIC